MEGENPNIGATETNIIILCRHPFIIIVTLVVEIGNPLGILHV